MNRGATELQALLDEVGMPQFTWMDSGAWRPGDPSQPVVLQGFGFGMGGFA
jgi:hypothetical protein